MPEINISKKYSFGLHPLLPALLEMINSNGVILSVWNLTAVSDLIIDNAQMTKTLFEHQSNTREDDSTARARNLIEEVREEVIYSGESPEDVNKRLKPHRDELTEAVALAQFTPLEFEAMEEGKSPPET